MTHITKHWAETDDSGKVIGVRKMKARKHVVQEGCQLITEGDFQQIRSNPDLDFFMIDDELVARPKIVPYTQARAQEYPEIVEQIAALMKAADGDDTDLRTLLKTIKNVKQKYPKT
jgi:hypothetical protein